MTVKEIIDGLKFAVDMGLFDPSTGETCTEPRNDMDKTAIDACRGAIKLLEQQPCEDAISRQVVKEQMIKYGFLAPDMTVTEFIEDLPPVTLHSSDKWIPVGGKKLPKEGEEVLVSGYDTFNKKIIISRYQGKRYGFTCGLISAWMPLPKPYKAESEE